MDLGKTRFEALSAHFGRAQQDSGEITRFHRGAAEFAQQGLLAQPVGNCSRVATVDGWGELVTELLTPARNGLWLSSDEWIGLL